MSFAMFLEIVTVMSPVRFCILCIASSRVFQSSSMSYK